ncbi:class I SAM-dependent methyltransferase [Gemmobacter lutimaris]|uniref:Class I SAM-dependent methyltransferase n=1 Tax=Gemmobacter lutimaris TaxID=2306023 RepID=A0A398BNS7_9RHOB|nr:SAM-dependent methyltransferase [Gemmobacter lutimaris]RID92175.1 class I SAM-dependent methyltransferase [Gemmobacter lutimaris]
MTPLKPILRARIAAAGPMTLAEYMGECLLHPDHGYYTTHEPFGQTGDFITAPEISQMFGELLGLCLAQSWLDLGAPAPFTLAELGPGRGTLMADVLRATARVPGFHGAAQITLVEASPALRARQHATLGAHPVTWLDSANDLPEAPLFLLANEFFDALPIRQFTRAATGWEETVVTLRDGALSLARGPALPIAALDHRLADTAPGEVVEICPAALPVMAPLGARITQHGGVALILDYGGWQSRGDTFQALRNHAFTDPLAAPGAADLTAHVDFAALAQATPCPAAYTTQGALLGALGIEARAAALAQRLDGAALQSHLAATRRLTDPEEMGTLFKALALHRPGTAPPPGFPAEPPRDKP